MPIYEYYCGDCKEPFEIFVRSMSAKIEAACPKCGGQHVQKEVSAAAALGIGGEGAMLGAAASSCAPSG